MAGSYTDIYGDLYAGDPAVLLPPPPGGPQFAAGSRPHGNQATQDLTVLITNPFIFMTGGIFARMRQATTSQPLGSLTNSILQLDTVDEDPYNGWASASNSWMPPQGCSGWYQITGTVAASSASVQMRAMVTVNGAYLYTLQQNAPAQPYIQSGSVNVYLFGAVDYVQIQVFTYGSGLITDITAGQQSSMQVSWISN